MTQSRTATPPTPAAGRTPEAVWLVALATVPLAVWTFADGPFEPAKASLTLAFAVLLAVWSLRHGRTVLRCIATNPIAFMAAAYVAATALATAFSISLWDSAFGSFHRAQGLVTTLAYFAVFLAIASGVRNTNQARRLIWAVVLAATLMGIVGIAQNAGIEPLGITVEASRRAPSTAGNPIFFGAFMVFGIVLAVATAMADTGLRRWGWLCCAAVQTVAIAGTVSRGPWLGLLAGLAVLGWLRRGRLALHWPLARRPTVIVGTVALLGIAVALGSGLGEGGVGRALRLGRTGTIQVRLDAWDAVSRTMLSPGSTAAVLHTPLADLRMTVGYGPETMAIPVSANVSIEQPTLEQSDDYLDRAHNEVLQHLVERGTLGMLALLAVWFAVLRAAVGPGCRPLSSAAASLIVVLALVTPWLITGSLAWSGAMAALAVLLGALRPAPFPTNGPPADARDMLLAGVAAAVAGHVVELQSGILVTPTALAFWALAGLAASPWAQGAEDDDTASSGLTPRVAAAALAVLLLGFAVAPEGGVARWAYQSPSWPLVWVGLAAAAAAAVVLGLVYRGSGVAGVTGFATWGAGVVALPAICWRIAASASPESLPGEPYWLIAGGCATLAALAVVALYDKSMTTLENPRRAASSVALVVLAIAGPAYGTATTLLAGLGNVATRQGDPDRGIRLYERSLHIAPREVVRWQRLAGLHLRAGQASGTGAEEQAVEAVAAMRSALELAPLSSEIHSDLGEILTWQAAARPTESAELLEEAITHLVRAQQLRPGSRETAQRLRTARNLRLVIGR